MRRTTIVMMTWGWVLAGCTGVAAQYDHLLKADQPAPAEKLKAKKYLKQTISSSDKPGMPELPEGVAYYDEEGRLVRRVDRDHRRYYEYDEAGRMSRFIDSVKSEGVFVKKEYQFKYDGGGRPQEFVLDKKVSRFTWDGAKNQLTETASLNGSVEFTAVYNYTPDGKLQQSVRRNTAGNMLEEVKYKLNPAGMIQVEAQARLISSGVYDTTLVAYIYDGKGRVIEKRTIVKNAPRLPNGEPDTARLTEKRTPRVEKRTYSYSQVKDWLATETCEAAGPASAVKCEYGYDDAGLPTKETRTNAKGEMVGSRSYFYNGKW